MIFACAYQTAPTMRRYAPAIAANNPRTRRNARDRVFFAGGIFIGFLHYRPSLIQAHSTGAVPAAPDNLGGGEDDEFFRRITEDPRAVSLGTVFATVCRIRS